MTEPWAKAADDARPRANTKTGIRIFISILLESLFHALLIIEHPSMLTKRRDTLHAEMCRRTNAYRRTCGNPTPGAGRSLRTSLFGEEEGFVEQLVAFEHPFTRSGGPRRDRGSR